MDYFKKDYPQLLEGSSQGLIQPVAPSASFSTPSQGVTSKVAIEEWLAEIQEVEESVKQGEDNYITML